MPKPARAKPIAVAAAAAAGASADSSEEKHHKYRCRDLKRQLEELEEYNEILAIRLLRSQKRLRRMKIERNLLLERFERTRPYNDSGSDSDVPLKDTFPRPPASDVELIETIYTAGNARSRRKAQQSSSASVLGTPPQPNAANGGANDPTATIAATNLSTRKPRSEKDPNAPKRPANAFVLFCQAERPNIKNAGTELSSSELTRAMGAKWKALSFDEKQKYYALYDREMSRYQQELESYKGVSGNALTTTDGGVAGTNAVSNAVPSSSSSSSTAAVPAVQDIADASSATGDMDADTANSDAVSLEAASGFEHPEDANASNNAISGGGQTNDSKQETLALPPLSSLSNDVVSAAAAAADTDPRQQHNSSGTRVIVPETLAAYTENQSANANNAAAIATSSAFEQQVSTNGTTNNDSLEEQLPPAASHIDSSAIAVAAGNMPSTDKDAAIPVAEPNSAQDVPVYSAATTKEVTHQS